MARKGTRQFEAHIKDNLSDSEIVFYYTLPTTADTLQFQNNFVKRNRDVIEEALIGEQVELGLKLITGFRDGDFEREVDGEWVPMSADPESPAYYEDWRAWLREYASDLLEWFVVHVFRRSPAAITSSVRGLAEGK